MIRCTSATASARLIPTALIEFLHRVTLAGRVIATQSIHVAVGVPATTTGRDAAKRVPGRKRCLAVDVLGLVIDCVVLPASAHENTAGIALLDAVTEQCDTVKKALVS